MKRRGFTLVEVMLAIMMMGIITTAVYSGFRAAYKARQAVLSTIGPANSAEATLDMIRRDIESALPSGGVIATKLIGDENPDMRGTSIISFCTLAPMQDPQSQGAIADTGAVNAIRGAGTIDLNSVGLQRVEFAVVPSQSSASLPGGMLVKRIYRDMIPATNETPQEEILLRGVRGFLIEYYTLDTTESVWSEEQLPLAISIALEIETSADGTSAPYQTSRKFFLSCQSDPNAQTTTTAGGTS